MKKQTLPKGWSEKREHNVIAHYEGQSGEAAEGEDDAAYRKRKATLTGRSGRCAAGSGRSGPTI